MSLPYSKAKMAFVFLSIVIFSCCVNYFIKLESYRNLTSDAITISSILLAILGIYFGVLSTLEERSSFFEKAREFGQNENIIKGLVQYICWNVYINIVFIFVTIIYDVAPHLNNYVIKITANIFWLSLFVIVLLGTVTVVHFIMKIYLFEDNKDNLET